MAICRTIPEDVRDIGEEVLVRVDSDALDNAHAILEIERWCREHGFTRSRENWLAALRLADGTQVRRGLCYRMSSEELERLRGDIAELQRHVAAMPLTRSSADLLEE